MPYDILEDEAPATPGGYEILADEPSGRDPVLADEIRNVLTRGRANPIAEPKGPLINGESDEWAGAGRALQRGLLGAQALLPTLALPEAKRNLEREQSAAEIGLSPDLMRNTLQGVRVNPAKESAKLIGRSTEERAAAVARAQMIRDVWAGVAADFQKEIQDVPRSQAQAELAAAIGSADKWSVFRKYPIQTVSSIVLESLPPSIAGSVLGTAAGGPGLGTAVGAGLGSAAQEFSGEFLKGAAEAGFDPTDERQLSAFLDSPAYTTAFNKALLRGFLVGGVDTGTAGAAGRFIAPALKTGLGNVIKATGKETLLQAGGGAGGELVAQAATKGDKPFDWFDIAMEAAAEIATGPTEAFSNIRQEISQRGFEVLPDEELQGAGDKLKVEKPATSNLKPATPPADTSADALAELQAVLRGEAPGSQRLKGALPKVQPEPAGAVSSEPVVVEKRVEVPAALTEEQRAAVEFQRKTDEAVKAAVQNPDKNYEGMSKFELELLEGMGDARATAALRRMRARRNANVEVESAKVAKTASESGRPVSASAPEYHYASPESKAWWEKLDELNDEVKSKSGTPEVREARKRREDHSDLAYTQEGRQRGLSRRRIDINNPLAQVNATASIVDTMGQADLTGWKFSGETGVQEGRKWRRVVSDDGSKAMVVWDETLHPLERAALEKNASNSISADGLAAAMQAQAIPLEKPESRPLTEKPKSPTPKPPTAAAVAREGAREFDRLVLENAMQAGWVTSPESLYDDSVNVKTGHGTGSIKAKILRSKELARARKQAAAAIGAKDVDLSDTAKRGALAARLKEWVADNVTGPARQNDDFSQSIEKGAVGVPVSEMKVGDTLNIEGEPVRVVEVSADGEVTLQDGTRFGRQVLQDGTTIYAEEWQSVAEEGADSFPTLEDISESLKKPEPDQTAVEQGGTKPAAPTLKSGQKQGDLLGSGDIPFNLFAEQTQSGERIEAERQQREEMQRAAKAFEEKNQRELPVTSNVQRIDNGDKVAGMSLENEAGKPAAGSESQPGQGATPISDSDGPVTFYHGTSNEFQEFASGKPIWFTPDESAASARAYGKGRRVIKANLVIENPLRLDGRDADGVHSLIDYLRGLDDEGARVKADQIEQKLKQAVEWEEPDGQTVRVYLPSVLIYIKRNHDAVVFEDYGMEDYHEYFDSYVVFEPNQILVAEKPPVASPINSSFPDSIESALDKAIDATDFKPRQVNEGVTGAPVWLTRAVANGALRIVRAAYRGARSLAQAIRDAVEFLRAQNLPDFNEQEAQAWLESKFQPGVRDELATLTAQMDAIKARGEEIPADMLDEYKELVDTLGDEIRSGRANSGAGRIAVDQNLEESNGTRQRTGQTLRGIPQWKGAERLPGGRLKDLFTGLRAWRVKSGNWLARRGARASIVVNRDVADNRANQAATAASLHVRLILNRAFDTKPGQVRVKHEVREAALTFVVEADGERSRLSDFYDQIGASEHADTKAGRQALAALEYAEANWDKLQPAAAEYKTLTETEREAELNEGVNSPEWKGGYVKHSWARDDVGAGADPTKPAAAGTPFRKPRSVATYAEGIAQGRKPTTLNALELLADRVAGGQRKLNELSWVHGLRNLMDPVTDMPVVMDVIKKPRKPANLPAEDSERAQAQEEAGVSYKPDWVTIAPEGYTVWRFGELEVAVQENFVGLLNKLTAASFFKGSSVKKVFGFIKSSLLMFDTFHLGRMVAWRQMFGLGGGYQKGQTLLDFSAADIREMAARGEIPEAWADGLQENKRRLDLALRTGFNVGTVLDNAWGDALHNLPVVGTFNHWLFGQYQRGAMTEAWLIEFERMSRALPNASEEQVARRVSKDLNARFGNLNRQGLFKSRTAQDLARFVFLAPQWNESLIRAELGAIVQTLKTPMESIQQRRLVVGTLMKATGAMALGTFLANQILNYAFRGKPTWENEEEGWDKKISAYIPDAVSGGPGFFLNPLALPMEYTHLIEGNLHRSGGDLSEALRRVAVSRLHAAARPAEMFLTRKDALGAKLRDGEVLPAMAKALIPIPIGAVSPATAAKQLISGEPSERFPGQYQKQMMASFGVKTDQAPSAEQRIRNLAREFNREKGIVPSAEFFTGDFDELNKALRIGNNTEARKALDELLLKKTPRQVFDHYKRVAAAPFTGQQAREKEFWRGLTEEQRSQYLKAREARKATAKKAAEMLKAVAKPRAPI